MKFQADDEQNEKQLEERYKLFTKLKEKYSSLSLDELAELQKQIINTFEIYNNKSLQ